MISSPTTTVAIANPTTTIAVSESLLEYLQLRFGIGDLKYREAPSPINEGWETFIYRFQLRGGHGLPGDLNRPLILRVYSSISGLPRLQHEAEVQRHLYGRGYPVARPLLVEESDSLFGGPFMIMELLPGRTLLDELFKRFWRIAHAPVEMAEMQAQLHRMPVGGFPAPAGDFLDRKFRDMRDLIDEYDQDNLRAGLDWLEDHRPCPRAGPASFTWIFIRSTCCAVGDVVLAFWTGATPTLATAMPTLLIRSYSCVQHRCRLARRCGSGSLRFPDAGCSGNIICTLIARDFPWMSRLLPIM